MTEARPVVSERVVATRKVTLVGAVVNIVLSVVKIAFGWLAHCQSLVADGVHSLSDLLSDVLVWFAAGHAAQGPDSDHPYGHGRFETLATLGLGLLLILVAVGISWDAASRLFSPERLLVPGSLALVVAFGSVLAKEWLYHYTIRVAKRAKSDMLRANAWHHRSDAVSSIVVLVGVGGTMAGLPYLDSIAAFIVGLMIAHIGWELSWPAVQELADAGLEEERLEKIRRVIRSVDGVEEIHMLRTRLSAGQASADVHLLVNPRLSVSEGHMIGQMVIDRLQEDVEEITDVTVHIDPEDDEVATPSRGLPLREEAESILEKCWQDMPASSNAKRLVLHYLSGKIDVDIFFSLEDFKDRESTNRLAAALQSKIEPLDQFGSVRIYYG